MLWYRIEVLRHTYAIGTYNAWQSGSFDQGIGQQNRERITSFSYHKGTKNI